MHYWALFYRWLVSRHFVLQAGSLPLLPAPRMARTVPRAHRMARMGSTEPTAVGGVKARMAAMAAKAMMVVMVERVGMVATEALEVAMEVEAEMVARSPSTY